MHALDISWLLVALAFLLGLGVGALLHYFLSERVTAPMQTHQELAEKEREISQLNACIREHLEHTLGRFNQLKTHLELLGEDLGRDAEKLCKDPQVVEQLKASQRIRVPESATDEKPEALGLVSSVLEPPRDYDISDTRRSILAEDYGLRPEVFEPPRH